MNKQSVILSDSKLWKGFLSGDANSFKLIYEQSIQDLFAYGKSFCQDQEIVKDCIQDLFIEIYSARTRLSSTDKILPYLMVVLKRIIIRKLRKLETNKNLDFERLPFILEIGEEEDDSGDEDNLEILKVALSELSPRQKEAIHLKYVAGLSYTELAKVMNLNYQTSRNLISRAVQKLRAVLSENQPIILFFLKLAGVTKN